MNGNHVDPTRDSFARLKDLPRDHPVEILNLVKLRDRVEYLDGNVTTGRLAYAAYGRESSPVFRKVGGKIIWSGEPQFMLIGPDNEKWDIAFIARYPTGQAFLDMVYDPVYQAIVHHRQLAVETSRLIRMQPRKPGMGFGE